MTFVDIAGLVRGASKGEGLGNQFLANIRECDAIAHVLRCFEDGDITHVEGRIDPVADAETIETELMLADLDSIERRRANLARKMKGGDKEAADQDRLLSMAEEALAEGKPARSVKVAADDLRNWRLLQLLTVKAGAVCLQCRGILGRGGQFPIGAGGGNGGRRRGRDRW